MKQLKFDHKQAQAVISGEKSTTLRIDDKHVSVGDKLQIVDKTNNSEPDEWMVLGELYVESLQEYELSKLPTKLIKSADLKIKTKEGLKTFLRRFYGESVGDSTAVKLISFKYLPFKESVSYMARTQLSESVEIRKVRLYADGGSRGNPGPSAAGFVILDTKGSVIHSDNSYLGITTNNQAEYHALIMGLEWCRARGVSEVEVYLDSLLVVNQLKGTYRVKNRDLWALHDAAKKLENVFRSISIVHVPRELNRLADAEVNKALDAVKGEDVVQ